MTRTVAIIGTRGYPSFYGGFETLVRHLAPYLADQGWDVVVYGRHAALSSNPADRDSRVRSVVTPGVDSKSASTLTYGATSSIHAAVTKIDVALVMNVANGFWLPLLRLRNIPTMVNVDGIEWEREKWGRIAKTIFAIGGRATAKHATTLIYDSRELGARWEDLSGRTGVFIPYGGDPRTGDDPPDGLGRRKYVLMVARFVPENTITPFLDAVENLSERWEVVIVGSSGYGGEFDHRVAALAAEKPNVRWYGHLSDDDKLFSLWENAGAYFHGHSVGGTNPALVQAMACGAPVVARDTVYNREVLAEGALFVDPTPQSIAAGLEILLNDSELQQRFSAISTQRAHDHYTWERVCVDYDRALRSHLPSTDAVSEEKTARE
ncbi:glycosyltransferase [Rhodococcus sp. IEGM 1330]|uniref:glycosyltransferase n=1 Tax=Rhodococcus sp. IEGM 1330 TaxID=3082225 RepID=UPI00295380E6|nr:glycosyltransferase [Rhodococcus sp. IEGM 1330]MDV8023638.1 glycosyltransferase [Rhodococcus sp. IEGM 1330]